MIIRIIPFEWTKLAYESRDMDQTCVFEENYSGFHGIRSVFRGKTQWTKLASECICRHMTEEVVDQTWDPRVHIEVILENKKGTNIGLNVL